jgi:DNA-binding LytR/AlgR family response regulator
VSAVGTSGQPFGGGPAMALHCLVVGGNPDTASELVHLLCTNPVVGPIVTAPNADAALRLLHSVDVDLAFIELHMPGMDGTDLAGVLNRFQVAPAIVFTAPGPQGAVEAFDLGAVDYLTRPVPPARLAESLRRVVAVRHAGSTPPRKPTVADDQIVIVCLGGTTRLISRSSVRWAQARRDYVRLHTLDGSYLIRARITALADEWAGAGLIRIHRSYLVRLSAIDTVRTTRSGHLCVSIDGQQLPISRRLVPMFWHSIAGI